MKISTTISIDVKLAQKLPDLKKKINVNSEIEFFLRELFAKNKISVK